MDQKKGRHKEGIVRASWFFLALTALASDVPGSTSSRPGRAAPGELVRPSPSRSVPRSVAFELNRGQTGAEVKFLARGSGYTLFLTAGEAVLAMNEPRGEGAVVRMKLTGANPAPDVEGVGRLPGRTNYFRPGDPRRQLADVPTYASVLYRQVYPGVDLVYHGRHHQLEYDFVVAPGADPAVITLAFEGVDELEVDDRGDLVLRTAGGELRQPRPVIYQYADGFRSTLSGGYVLINRREVAFAVETFDASLPLVIDPRILYSSYLGGRGDDLGTGIAVDAQGNMYVAATTTSPDFPVTSGAQLAGGSDAVVSKLDASGTVIYSTYVGGAADELSGGIAVDAAGNAYITGRSDGASLPPEPVGVLVAKLDPTGAGVYFFVFGGSSADTSRGQAIAVDGDGSAYVTGLAWSSSGDFPTTPGAFQRAPAGSFWADGFVAKVHPAGAGLVYSTYLGGSGHDSANAIAIDATGNAYVGGSTESIDFPTLRAYQPRHHGAGPSDTNAFVAKLNPNGSALVYSTYLGGGHDTAVQGIAVDSGGNAYVTGYTLASDFPTTAGTLQPEAGSRICGILCSDAFVTKLAPSGSSLVYSTYLYGEGDDQGFDIAVDESGNAYVVGETDSLYFPIVRAFQPRNSGLFDGFVAKLSGDGSTLVYSSYFGGGDRNGEGLEGWDRALGIALDRAGNAHVVGQTYSFDFPVTEDALDSTFAAGLCGTGTTLCGDGFVTKIAPDGSVVNPGVDLSARPAAVPIGGTVTATWAGIPAPTSSDRIHLNALGGGGFVFDELAAWSTDGAPGGTMDLTLPSTLRLGWYELRLLGLEGFSTLTVIARSEPFRVGAAAFADLAVISIVTTPAHPAPDEAVAVTVTVENRGTAPAESFLVDLYGHRTAAPAPHTDGDFRCAIPRLEPGATAPCSGTIVYRTAGTFGMWAQVDTAQAVAESDEANNVSGPRAITVGRIRFHRGDPNSSGITDLSDVIAIFGFLFIGNVTLGCRESADVDNNGQIDLSDGIYLLNWLFAGGTEPLPPGPSGSPCGVDPDLPGSPADLGCEAYPACD